MSGSSNSSDGSVEASSRQVQFGLKESSNESVELSSAETATIDEELRLSFKVENVNEFLRHKLPSTENIFEIKHLSRVMSSVSTVLLQYALQRISLLRARNRMPKVEIKLEYVPLEEKYTETQYDIVKAINSDENYLAYHKFLKDIAWLEKILKTTVINLQRSFYYHDLITILRDHETTREQEESLLGSKKFNRKELSKLRFYIESDRKEWMEDIKELTDEIGRLRNQINDEITANKVKKNYTILWEKSRNEQNIILLKKEENDYVNTIDMMDTTIDKENRVHEEMWDYLKISLEEYQENIEKMMDKYDNDMDEKEQNLQDMKVKLENQKDEHLELLDKYNRRVKEINDYKNHKLQKEQEAQELEKRTLAAIKIQSWWRDTMFRLKLGPYRRRKRKRNKGGKKKKK